VIVENGLRDLINHGQRPFRTDDLLRSLHCPT
jgi:hypothetical protein